VSRVPVTLVTGFLGAGKTTLLNHVLGEARARRIAVVENDFGDINIDSELLEPSPDALFELTEGCVCCSVRADLVDVFSQLEARPLDHVIIETSGLADPAPVLTLFDTSRFRSFRLASVVTVVDAGNLAAALEASDTAARQIAQADLLVLNKADQVSQPEAASLKAKLRRLNPLAHYAWTVRGRVPAPDVLDLNGIDIADRDLDERVDAHEHDDEIRAISVELDGDIDVAALDVWLGQLLDRHGSNLLRMKGVLAVPGEPKRFVFQAVRRTVDLAPQRPWGLDPRRSRLVFIGRGLPAKTLREGFAACRPA